MTVDLEARAQAQFLARQRELGVKPGCAHTPPDLWFDSIQEYQGVLQAICAECPLLSECRELVDAVERPRYRSAYGFWAGETPWQRGRRRADAAKVERRLSRA